MLGPTPSLMKRSFGSSPTVTQPHTGRQTSPNARTAGGATQQAHGPAGLHPTIDVFEQPDMTQFVLHTEAYYQFVQPPPAGNQQDEQERSRAPPRAHQSLHGEDETQDYKEPDWGCDLQASAGG